MAETGSERKRRVVSELTLDLDLCKACGVCHDLCPRDVFDTDERGYPLVARLSSCTVCRTCEYHCPDFAISVFFHDESRAAPAESVADDAAEPPAGDSSAAVTAPSAAAGAAVEE